MQSYFGTRCERTPNWESILNVSRRCALVLSVRQIQDPKLMSEELNPELEGQIQEQAAAEVEASPEVTEVESTPEVEALEDSATPTELEANDESVEEYDLELVLEDEEEES